MAAGRRARRRAAGSKMAIEAAATIEVSGIQWPLLGTGSVGSAGRRPPTSRKLHSAGAVKPWPVGQLLADHAGSRPDRCTAGSRPARRPAMRARSAMPEQDQQVPPAHLRSQMAAVESRVHALPQRRGVEPVAPAANPGGRRRDQSRSGQGRPAGPLQADDRHVHLEQLVAVHVGPPVHEDRLVRPMLADVAAPLVPIEDSRPGSCASIQATAAAGSPRRSPRPGPPGDAARSAMPTPSTSRTRDQARVDGAQTSAPGLREAGEDPATCAGRSPSPR